MKKLTKFYTIVFVLLWIFINAIILTGLLVCIERNKLIIISIAVPLILFSFFLSFDFNYKEPASLCTITTKKYKESVMESPFDLDQFVRRNKK